MKQSENFFDKFNINYPELKDSWDKYRAYWHHAEVSAGTVLIREGERAKKVFLIEKGCIRAWVNNKGRDITFQFFFENEFVSSGESFRNNLPSYFTIETIEPCTLFWLHKKEWKLIMQDLSMLPGIKEKAIEDAFKRQNSYIKQFISFITDSPEQRYLNLLKERPYIIQRVPLKYIATYLGITQVSLSRIRKRVKSLQT